MATLISEYAHKPSSDSSEAGEWKASLMEKLWIALMAIALAVATITAAADGAGIDSPKASAPAQRVFVGQATK